MTWSLNPSHSEDEGLVMESAYVFVNESGIETEIANVNANVNVLGVTEPCL